MFKKIFFLDDRTGLLSTTKVIRWLTWAVSVLTIINLQCVIYFNWVEINADDVSMLQIVERLIMVILPTVETSYQFNRNNKMKNGNVVASESLESANKIVREEF